MTPSQKAKESKTFCIYPWVHQYVGPMGDVKPCCVYTQEMQLGSMKENTLKEIWNNDTTKQMRLDMLNGVEVEGCAKCNNRVGIVKPYRDEVNTMFFSPNDTNVALVDTTQEDGTLDTHELQFIDARFNNLCNLKCRTCGPRFSTSWHEDYQKAKPKSEGFDPHESALQFPGKDQDQLLEEIMPHLSSVRHIYFAGGEPLMQIEHYKVLEELIRLGRTDVKIDYNSNFTNLKLGKYTVLDMWPKFNKIRMLASLDGSYEKAEYWRKGTKWDVVVANRKATIEQCPDIDFKISYTLGWNNAQNLVEFHKEWVELGLLNINDMVINLLDVPVCYSLKTVPTWKKKQIEKLFKTHIIWMATNKASPSTVNRYLDAIKFMYSVDSGEEFLNATFFKQITDTYDVLRNEDFWTVYPEHNDIREFLNAST